MSCLITKQCACDDCLEEVWKSVGVAVRTPHPDVITAAANLLDRLLLALSKANNSGCMLTDVKCVVLQMADKAIGVGFCIQVQGLIGRGFVLERRNVAVPVSNMQTNFEVSSTNLQRQSAPFEMLKCNQLVPLGEVSIVTMSPRELQDCSSCCTATLHSMPILYDGFDSHEVDSAPLISFFFDNQTSNFMCVLH